MICPICKGKRFLLYDAEPFNCALKTPCKRCDGTGNVAPTNFEKITQSPEALAEFISDITVDCWCCNVVYSANCPHRNKGMTDFCDRESALEWLKQKSVQESVQESE